MVGIIGMPELIVRFTCLTMFGGFAAVVYVVYRVIRWLLAKT
jgi:hypothetical protein